MNRCDLLQHHAIDRAFGHWATRSAARLFGVIHVVEAVADECAAGGPVAVPELSSLPWIRLIAADESDLPGLLLNLDRGERDTLAMARKFGAKRAIIDERIGRNMAELLGLQVTGTLGVLLKAKEQGWIPSFYEAVTQMQRNGIFYQQGLLQP